MLAINNVNADKKTQTTNQHVGICNVEFVQKIKFTILKSISTWIIILGLVNRQILITLILQITLITIIMLIMLIVLMLITLILLSTQILNIFNTQIFTQIIIPIVLFVLKLVKTSAILIIWIIHHYINLNHTSILIISTYKTINLILITTIYCLINLITILLILTLLFLLKIIIIKHLIHLTSTL
jgi:hypothetical protein